MFVTPSMDDLIESVILALQDDIMPAIVNPKAFATVAMAMSILQQVRQALPVYDQYLAEEHNGMTKALRDAADALRTASGPEADRIRERGRALGARPDFPAPLARAAVMAAHRECNQAVVDNMVDLDVLQRAGDEAAERALTILRAHLGPRCLRDAQTLLVGAGMIGRG